MALTERRRPVTSPAADLPKVARFERSSLLSFAALGGLLVLASFAVDPYLAYVATSWMIFGLVGLSLDLVWGRGGILSLGQTAFYGLGGYLGSIAAINFASLTGNTLVWSLPVGAAAGAVTAMLIGWLIFYGRLGPLQTTILTYTLTLVLWTVSVSFTATIGDAVVGGDNGMSNIPGYVIGFGDGAPLLEPNTMFLTVAVIAVAIWFASRTLMRSPFGLVIDCIRMDPVKTELLGYDIRFYQLVLFAIAGAIAGLAGSLFGAWSNYLNPSVFSVQEALLVPIYVLVGGRGSLVGAFLGALVVGGLSFWLGGGVIGGQTTLVMGACLILLVIFLRHGLIGGVRDLLRLAGRLVPKLRDGDGVAERTASPRVDFDRLDLLRSAGSGPGNVVLETRDAFKRFGGVTPVRHVSQSFSPGRVRCLIGPNGAGKSSYLKACTGVYKPDGGTVTLDGRDITKADPFTRVRMGIGIKNQRAQVFGELDVRRNLWIAAYSRRRDSEAADRITAEMLGMLGMADSAARPASELSHGEQQWLDLGMVLALAPDVILLDEPAAGMTSQERRQLSEMVRALARTASVVVVEHDMDFVRTLDADVTVLHQGEVFARGDIDTLRNDERVLDIYLGRHRHV